MPASVTPTPTPIVPAQPVAVTSDLLVSFLISIVIALAIVMLSLAIGRFARAATLRALGVPWPTVVALAGVLGLAASLALQDVLKNFVAGVYLLVERPFRIGESIKVKEFSGSVETIDVRTTVLRTPEGDAIMVPNAILFAEIILNRGMPRPPAPPEPEEPERV